MPHRETTPCAPPACAERRLARRASLRAASGSSTPGSMTVSAVSTVREGDFAKIRTVRQGAACILAAQDHLVRGVCVPGRRRDRSDPSRKICCATANSRATQSGRTTTAMTCLSRHARSTGTSTEKWRLPSTLDLEQDRPKVHHSPPTLSQLGKGCPSRGAGPDEG